VAKQKRGPDPEILALMGEEEREKLLNRKPNRELDGYSDEEIREAGRAAARRLVEEQKLKRKKGKPSGKKSKPDTDKLMASNSGGRLQKQRAKHQTGNPRFF
jgi:hypothetical protein